MVGSSKTEAADALLRSCEEMLAEVHQQLLQAQQLSKKYYDANHREVELDVGAWVWLRLLHQTAQSLDPQARCKLGPSYAGPFQVLERVSKVAYRLQLLADARIQDVFFQVRLLKPHGREPPTAPGVMPPLLHGYILPEPETVVRAEQWRGVWYVRIKWRGLPDEDVTWEQLEEFRNHYPNLQLEDVLFAQAGRDVMTGRTFGPHPGCG
jgi:hypothetical protein